MSIIRTLIFVFSSILILVLPLIYSTFGELFGIHLGLQVDGNFEFTKVMFFNIVSSFIIFFYIIGIYIFPPSKKEKIKIPKIVYFFYVVLIISTYFSLSPYHSLFGSNSKAHGFLMFNNLIGLFYIYMSLLQKYENKIQNILIVSGIMVSLVGLWIFFVPSLDYGDLGNRLLGSFGHPNYLSLYILLFIPLVYEKYLKSKNTFYIIIFILFSVTIFLTKSVVGITLLIHYILFIAYKKNKNKSHSLLYIYTYIVGIILGICAILYFYPEKVPSFLSRFYIWETTLKIIFSDFKILFVGIGLENLPLLFDNFKSVELYIFENIGFTADRPHNIILNFFIHFGLGGLVVILSFYYYVFKNITTGKWYNTSLFLAAIFLLFNFASIASYLLIGILLSFSLKNNSFILGGYKNKLFISIIAFVSLLSIYSSYYFYQAELFAYKKDYISASKTFPYTSDYFYKLGDLEKGLSIQKIRSEKYYLSQIYNSPDIVDNCKKLIEYYSTVENYLYCGELLERIGYKTESLNYYKLGVNKLPDLRNENSFYYNNILIKYFSSLGRYLSPKYSNLEEILHKVGK